MKQSELNISAMETEIPKEQPSAGDGQTASQSPVEAAKVQRLSDLSPLAYPKTLASVTASPEPFGQNQGTPQVLGYRCLRLLGTGTFGEVWLAEDVTGVKCAIKLLKHNLGQEWQLLTDEIRQLALLQHDPGIVRLIDFDASAARPFYVMEYVEGGSLADRLREGPLPPRDAAKMFRRIAHALAYVHARGIRHCDLKPGNILLDSRNHPRIADFGQAHLAADMKPALGTFFYMAPEQADLTGRVPGTRWDVYGLGAIFYHYSAISADGS